MMTALLNFMVLAAVVYAGLVGVMYVFQRSLMYHPASGLPSAEATGIANLRTTSLTTEDGLSLVAWFIPPADPEQPVVVYFPGNAGHIGGRLFKAERFQAIGYGVLLVSYRGYGGNPGKPTEEGLFADARAALAYLNHAGISRRRIVLYGESLGTGVAVNAAWEAEADENPVAAVILEAPFTSIANVASHHYPFIPAGILTKDRYDSAIKIADIAAPVLIVHAEDDRTVPIRFGKGLFAKAVEPKTAKWFRTGGHENLYDVGAFDEIRRFLEQSL